MTRGNPKVIVFYLGFLPAFLDSASLSLADLAVVVAIVAGIGVTPMAGYALLATRERRFLAGPRGMTWMNRGAGTLLIGAGVAVAAKSYPRQNIAPPLAQDDHQGASLPPNTEDIHLAGQ